MNKAHIWAIWRCEAKKEKNNVHEGGKMCQAGATGRISYLFYAKGKIILFYFFQVGVPKMTSSHNFRLKIVEMTPFFSMATEVYFYLLPGFCSNYIFLERGRAGALVGTLWEKLNNIFNLKPT